MSTATRVVASVQAPFRTFPHRPSHSESLALAVGQTHQEPHFRTFQLMDHRFGPARNAQRETLGVGWECRTQRYFIAKIVDYPFPSAQIASQRQSEVFASMFELPQGDGDVQVELYEGLPLVRLQDTSEEVCALLDALRNPL